MATKKINFKKDQLMSELAATTNMSQTQCEAVLVVVAKLIADKTLDEGFSVTIHGLGTFSPNYRPARQGRNPQNGEPLEIKARTVIKFKAVGTLTKMG